MERGKTLGWLLTKALIPEALKLRLHKGIQRKESWLLIGERMGCKNLLKS